MAFSYPPSASIAPTVNVLASSAATTASGAGTNTTAITGASTKQILSLNIPANSLSSKGSTLEVSYAWSMTNSANAKTLSVFLGGAQIGKTDSQTTVVSSTGKIRVRNAGATNAIVADVLNADGTSASDLVAITLDMTIDQKLAFRGACAGAGDTMKITSYEVTLKQAATAAKSKPLVAGKKSFYGVNCHPGYWPTVSAANMVSIMKSLGTTVLRLDWYGAAQNAAIQAYAQAFQQDGTGLQVYAVIGASMESTPGTAYASEAAAYAANFTLGAAAATALGPYGVTMYGCGNELDSKSAGGVTVRTPNVSVQGTKAADFNASVWPLLRGAVNGCMDGVRSVQPTALCGCNAFTNAAIFLSDALWDGTNLDGTPGFQQCRWDITDWHLYTESNASSVDFSGSTGTIQFDLLGYLASAYNRPILITEFNPTSGGTTDNPTTASTTTSWLTNWYGRQDAVNLAGVMFYDLFDSPYQIINADVAPFTLNQAGVAYKNFIAANPAKK